MKKKIFCVILFLILLFSVTASAYEVTEFEVNAANAILLSLDTDEVLYEKNITERVYPASITKIMTAAVILDAYPNPENETVVMSQNAFDMILGTGSSVLDAKVGEELNGKDALAAVLISSAGDIVYAYAEKVAGSVDAFVDKMNEKAVELGLNSTHYQNPIGLHDEENYTTVEDICTLTKYALKNYPLFKELTSLSKYKMEATNFSPARTLVSTNMMLDINTSYYYLYCTGVKTGFTDEAGRCLVSTASYNGYNYLCVTMNCPTINGTRNEFVTSKSLFRWAFNNFEYKSVLDTSAPVCEAKVKRSFDSDFVSVYPETQITSILPKEADNSTIVIKPTLISDTVNAPIKKGDVLGTAEIVYAENVIGTVNLVAGNDIRQSLLLTFFDLVVGFFSLKIVKTVLLIILLIIAGVVVYCILINRKSSSPRKKIKYRPYEEEELKNINRRTPNDSVSPPDPESDDYFNI